VIALLGDGPKGPRKRTEGQREEDPAEARVRPFAGMRTRVLISFLILLTLSTAASVLVLREVLISRIDDEVGEALTEEISELGRFSAQGVDPATGESFEGDLRALFDAYLNSHSPEADSATLAFVGTEAYAEQRADPELQALAAALQPVGVVDEPTSGNLDTELGPARYVAVPVRTGDEEGSLATAQLLGERREQVDSAVRIAVGVSIVVMLLASLFIWLAAGRAMAPLQALARTARLISETDLSRRIPVRGNDEIAQLGRTLNAMLDRLEAAFADQREFLADVSHELRTPITVIRGHIETLGEDPSERREAVMVIQDELDRMNRFVDDLLLLVRASRPDFLRPEPLDLDLLTHEVFAKARLLGDRAWVLEGTGLGLIEGDSQRLTQAVTNLASNAANHTGPGEPIWIGSSLNGSEARLWVRDEGPGIPAEEQRLIFERFARSQSVRGTGGAGLGLAIVKAIAEAHGGHVELESSLGKGARFTIVIPAQ
jgi:signal transduction histidine kinase